MDELGSLDLHGLPKPFRVKILRASKEVVEFISGFREAIEGSSSASDFEALRPASNGRLSDAGSSTTGHMESYRVNTRSIAQMEEQSKACSLKDVAEKYVTEKAIGHKDCSTVGEAEEVKDCLTEPGLDALSETERACISQISTAYQPMPKSSKSEVDDDEGFIVPRCKYHDQNPGYPRRWTGERNLKEFPGLSIIALETTQEAARLSFTALQITRFGHFRDLDWLTSRLELLHGQRQLAEEFFIPFLFTGGLEDL
ncbi:hypothetical protein BJ170DRAFT_590951 [Xylariales sp. AK1849]|nr:hypothetical protein BJ170DRAFT_590951 [Xylariales sp. AK1849]